MQSVYVLMSIPGAGKSYLANNLQNKLGKDNTVICCADDYHMCGSIYKFNPAKLGEAHYNCRRKFYAFLQNGYDIIVSNTNCKYSDCQFYLECAIFHGTDVYLIEPETDWRYDAEECFKRNVHGVPLVKIQEMLRNLTEFKSSRKYLELLALGVKSQMAFP